jgi:hypothetical protein
MHSSQNHTVGAVHYQVIKNVSISAFPVETYVVISTNNLLVGKRALIGKSFVVPQGQNPAQKLVAFPTLFQPVAFPSWKCGARMTTNAFPIKRVGVVVPDIKNVANIAFHPPVCVALGINLNAMETVWTYILDVVHLVQRNANPIALPTPTRVAQMANMPAMGRASHTAVVVYRNVQAWWMALR